MNEEDEEVGKVKEEKDLHFEEFGPIRAYDPITLEKIGKLIPKMDIGARVKVFLKDGKYFPLTKTGATLVMAYRQVGFSYIPSVVVEAPPPPKEGEVPKAPTIHMTERQREAFLEMMNRTNVWQPIERQAAPPRRRF